MTSLRALPVNNKHGEGTAVSVQKRTAYSNSIFLGQRPSYDRNSPRNAASIMVTSALIYRRLKVGAANFLIHQWIEQQPSSFFAAGIEKLVPRWDKCLNVLGGYVEK